MNKSINLFKNRIKDPYELDVSSSQENINLVKQILEGDKPISFLESAIDIDYIRNNVDEKSQAMSPRVFIEMFDNNRTEEIVITFFSYGHPSIYGYFLKNKDNFTKYFSHAGHERIREIKRIFKYHKINPKEFAVKNNIVFNTLFEICCCKYFKDLESQASMNVSKHKELHELCNYFKISVKDSFKDENRFYRCKICSESYRNKFLLVEHLEKKHKIKIL
jgi:hypothetical protein